MVKYPVLAPVHRPESPGVHAGVGGRGVRVPCRGPPGIRGSLPRTASRSSWTIFWRSSGPSRAAPARVGESGTFTSAHEPFWAASAVNGDADGTRELIDVLLLRRSMGMPLQAPSRPWRWVLSVPTSSRSKPADTPQTYPRIGPVRTGWGHKYLRQPEAYRPLPQLVRVLFRCLLGSEPFGGIKILH